MKIGTTGTQTPFLPENELPPCGRLTTSSDHDQLKKEENEMKKAIDESKKMQQSSGNNIIDNLICVSFPSLFTITFCITYFTLLCCN